MQQLDLFGSLLNTSTEQKPEEKKPVAKKEEKREPEKEAPVERDLMNGIAVEQLSDEDLQQKNNGKKDDKKERENVFVFEDHLVPFTPVVSREETKKIEETAAQIKPGEVLQVEIEKDIAATKKTPKKESSNKVKEPKVAALPADDSIIFSDGKITVKLKSKPPVVTAPVVEKKEKIKKNPQKRGRKSFEEIDAEVDLIEIPEDEVLFQKQYYPISEVASWFRVNTSLLRFWENEFDVLKPRKNRKGDRLFRPEDVKNLQLIYQLLRQRKYTIEGAKEYIKTNSKKADLQLQLTQTLQKFKSFLLDLKANLQP